jgi:hypothetical protein
MAARALVLAVGACVLLPAVLAQSLGPDGTVYAASEDDGMWVGGMNIASVSTGAGTGGGLRRVPRCTCGLPSVLGLARGRPVPCPRACIDCNSAVPRFFAAPGTPGNPLCRRPQCWYMVGPARGRRGPRRHCGTVPQAGRLTPTRPAPPSSLQVISSIWIGAFALTSITFALFGGCPPPLCSAHRPAHRGAGPRGATGPDPRAPLKGSAPPPLSPPPGLSVAWQWPNPRCLCYKTPYSDLPVTGGGRACCSLYTLNVGFLVAWMLMLAIMAVSRDVIRIAVCVGFVFLHGGAVAAFRYQFRRKGRPAYPEAEMVRHAAPRRAAPRAGAGTAWGREGRGRGRAAQGRVAGARALARRSRRG